MVKVVVGGSYYEKKRAHERVGEQQSIRFFLLGFLLKIGVIFEVKLHMKPVENKGPDEVRLTLPRQGERDLLPLSYIVCILHQFGLGYYRINICREDVILNNNGIPE